MTKRHFKKLVKTQNYTERDKERIDKLKYINMNFFIGR